MFGWEMAMKRSLRRRERADVVLQRSPSSREFQQ
jgi:hypothetical protein